MKYLISWSGGKDSTATVILAHEHGLPVDEIIFCEVMYDRLRGISGELPEHIDFINNVAKPKFEEWGYKVTIVRAESDFLDLFYHRKTKGKRIGMMAGYLMSGKCLANKPLKVFPLKNYKKQFGEYCEYIGIAIDEPERLKRLKPPSRSLLADYGMTEKDAYDLCEKYGLLSPTYKITKRGGCWFCPNANIAHYAHIKSLYPMLYDEFINLGGAAGNRIPLLISDRFKFNMTIGELDRMVNEFIKANDRQMKLEF